MQIHMGFVVALRGMRLDRIPLAVTFKYCCCLREILWAICFNPPKNEGVGELGRIPRSAPLH